MSTYDVVVAGLGGFGSATAYHLASRGQRVLGLDPHPAGHALGASHGESRIVRQAYFEGTGYVPLLRRGAELWQRLQHDAGERLLVETGGLFLGRPGTRVFDGSVASAREWAVPHEVLDAAEVTVRWPAVRPPKGTAALFEPHAGVAAPERTVLAHLRLAAAAGARLSHGVALRGWEPLGDSVRVATSDGVVDSGVLVLAPGRWAPDLLGDDGLPLRVERRVMHWFRPAGGVAAYEVGRFPLWIWDRDDGTAPYGVPAMAGADGGVKASVHWSSEKPADAWSVPEVAAILEELLPGMPAEHLRSVDCTYTLTPDENFVVGRHPASPSVVLACGFSGHGFKFTPVLGEVLADLATGSQPAYDLAMFDPGRFGRSPA